MKKAKIYFELTRPQNGLIAALAVLVGALVSYPVESVLKLTLACISAGLISAGGYVINDYFDLDTDRVNKPQRPLPRGELSRKSALNFSLFLSGAGVVLSVFVKSPSVVIASVSAFLLFLYGFKLKRKLFVGNVVVSLICAFAFLYGGLVGSNFILSFIPAGFAFLFHLGREILKDVEDLKGDLLINARTIPIVLGKRTAFMLVTFIFSVLIALTLIPYLFHIFSFFYLLFVIFFVDAILIYAVLSMWKDPSQRNLGRLSGILKLDMLLGILAIFLGRL